MHPSLNILGDQPRKLHGEQMVSSSVDLDDRVVHFPRKRFEILWRAGVRSSVERENKTTQPKKVSYIVPDSSPHMKKIGHDTWCNLFRRVCLDPRKVACLEMERRYQKNIKYCTKRKSCHFNSGEALTAS